MFAWLKELLDLRLEYRQKKLQLLQDSKSGDLELVKTETSCKSCETLKMQLGIANIEKQKLLDTILNKKNEAETEAAPQLDIPRPVGSIAPIWSVRKRQLEAESRDAAQKIAERQRINNLEEKNAALAESIAKLEKEVVGDAANAS